VSQPTPSLDQLKIMLAVVEAGSFSGAARRLNRAQSAVTYAVQRLEEQLGTPLFDRTNYRPTLTEAGRALLPRMQRIAGEIQALGDQARGIAQGLEPELTLVIDAIFPMGALLDALRAFGAHFPSVSPRIYEPAHLIIEGACRGCPQRRVFTWSGAMRTFKVE
jgi:DNA-binding transcriptional LysR family regulator